MKLESHARVPNATGLLMSLFPPACDHCTGLFFCAVGLFSHLDEAQRPTVLKVTKLWLFVSVGEFVLQRAKALHLSFFFQILGKKNKLRVYYLSWLRNKILRNDPEVEKRQGWVSVGDLEGCVHYKVGKDVLVFSWRAA